MEEYLQKSNQLNRLEARRQLLVKALSEGEFVCFLVLETCCLQTTKLVAVFAL